MLVYVCVELSVVLSLTKKEEGGLTGAPEALAQRSRERFPVDHFQFSKEGDKFLVISKIILRGS